MFYKIFLQLCAENNKKPNNVTKDLGLSTATATDWKKGSVPRDVTLTKIAEYFGVSVDYLLGKEKSSTEEDEHMSEFAKLFPQLTEEEQAIINAQMEFMLSKRGKK
jgi:transcriptional regulator with XRE-family HTH domain